MKKLNLTAMALVIFGVVTALEAGKRKPRYCEVKELKKNVPGLPVFVNLPDGPLTGNEDFLVGNYDCIERTGLHAPQGKCGFSVESNRLKCKPVEVSF